MRYFSLILIIFTANISNAQDVIQKQNGVKIDATVISSGLSSISYRLFNSIDTTIYTIPKGDLKRIVYANGNAEVFVKSKTISKVRNNYDKENGNYTLKINPLSPLFGHTQLSFEQQIDNSNSIEYIVSFIGAGINSGRPTSIIYRNDFNNFKFEKKNQAGVSLGVGYKIFIRNQENKLNKVNQIASGFYLKPTAYLGWMSYNSYDIINNSNLIRGYNSSLFGALVLEPGFKLVVTKNLSVDFYIGLGYVFDNIDYEKSAFLDDGFGYGGGAIDIGYSYAYSILRLSEQSPGLAITGGVKLGWILNKKSSLNKNN